MKLCDICIKRPIFATVLSLVLMLFGWIGFKNLEIRYYPDVQVRQVVIRYSYQGASADYMADQVATSVEGALQGVEGVSKIVSTNSRGSSTITVTLSDTVNLIKAMADIRNKVSNVQDSGNLPSDMDPPSVTSGGNGSVATIFSFTSDTLDANKIRDYLKINALTPFKLIPGVGAVNLNGASSYALRIWLDPQKLAAYNVTATDVKAVLVNNNIDFSAGSILGSERNYGFKSNTRLTDVKEFKNLIVRIVSDENGTRTLRLKDVAKVELGSSSLQETMLTINGKNGILIQISPRLTANPIDVAQESIKVFNKIKKHLPKKIQANLAYDQTEFLKSAIDESFSTLLEAIALVIIVIYLFLGSFRATLIPVITIPVCCIGVLGVMSLLGFTINMLTLLAIILAIGLVVDDAIVMLENIHRHIEKGLEPMEAAFKGSKEIGFSVVAMTITLAAVYAPAGFMSGISAGYFREFAFTLAGAVLISGFVALTLSPMMCAYFLTEEKKEPYLSRKLNQSFDILNSAYQVILKFLLRQYWLVIIVLFLLGGGGYIVYKFMPQDFIPKEDIGFLKVNIAWPPSASKNFQTKYSKELDKIYLSNSGVKESLNSGGGASLTLKSWKKRESSQSIVDDLNAKLSKIAAVSVSLSIPPPVSYGGAGGGGDKLLVHIATTKDTLSLYHLTQKLIAKIRQIPGFSDVKSSLRFNNIIWNINFKRDAMKALNILPTDVSATINILLRGMKVTSISKDKESYDVRLQMQKSDLERFSVLNDIYVKSNVGTATMVPLTNLIDIKQGVSQGSIHHTDRLISADLTSSIPKGMGLNQVIKIIDKVLDENLSPDQSYSYGGVIGQYLDSSGAMLGLFILSIIFIYLVLSAQFESFVDPFIILFTVPLCIVSALVVLKLTGGSLNLITNIGLITLVGLITKHGILITQFANENFYAGANLFDAVVKSGVTRLRPILMTTLAMVLGALPLALAIGPGSVSHSQIGWVIVGGMSFGTVFSLLVVPVAYLLLSPLDYNKRKELRKRKK